MSSLSPLAKTLDETKGCGKMNIGWAYLTLLTICSFIEFLGIYTNEPCFVIIGGLTAMTNLFLCLDSFGKKQRDVGK